jgi:SPP1 gp7 family putative phage head morphogenesis protein
MYPLNLENQYEKYFERQFIEIAKQIKNALLKYLRTTKQDALHDSPVDDILRILENLKEEIGIWISKKTLERYIMRYFAHIDAWSRDKTNELLKNMLARLNTAQSSTLTLEMVNLESGLTKTLLERVVRQNVGLIKLLAMEHVDGVKQILCNGYIAGKSLTEMTDEIERLTGVNRSRAKFWARDQASKFFGEVTRTRQMNAGIPGYIWRTLKDGRVRDMHASVDGKYFDWKNPPHIGTDGKAVHPGEDYNCRCWAEPAFGKEYEQEKREDPLAYLRQNTREQEIFYHEKVIRNQINVETYQVFDKNGRVIGLQHGTSNVIYIDVKDLKKWKDCIMIHNHPNGWRYAPGDPRRAGNSFSLADIKTAFTARLAETRIITPRYRYIMRIGGRDKKYFDSAIKPLYNKYEEIVKNEFLGLIYRKQLTPEEAEAYYFHAIWERVCRDANIEYIREEL